MKPRRLFVRQGLGLVCTAAAAAIFLTGSAGQSHHSIADADAVPGIAAMRAGIDPETGALVTGPDAVAGAADKAADRELAEMVSRSTEGLVEVRHPEGHVSVNLEGRFMNASVARIDADGKVETLCAEDLDEARAFLDGAAPAAPVRETDARGLEVR
jgi:hypothetical protein